MRGSRTARVMCAGRRVVAVPGCAIVALSNVVGHSLNLIGPVTD
jgi:hypothetical protein